MLTAIKQPIDFDFPHWRQTLLAIFLAALAIRGVFILTLQDGYYFPDSVSYSGAAVNLLTNGELGKAYNRPPGYPVFLAAIYLLFGNGIFAVRMVESVMGALLAVVIAMIARRIGGTTVGALAGFLWSIYPIAVFITGLVYPTNLLTTLLALGILCFVPKPGRDLLPKQVFLASSLWGLATLTIPIVLVTVAAISAWLMYWGGVNRFRLVFALILGASLTILPWIIRDFYVYDRLVLVEPRASAHLPRIRTADKSIRDNKIEAILQYPAEYAQRMVGEFLHFWTLYPERITMDKPGFRERMHEQDPRVVRNTIFTTNDLVKAVSILTTGSIFLFAIIGSASMWFQQERRYDLSLLWTVILSFAIGYSLFYSKLRYRIPIEPYIMILSAYGLTKTWASLARHLAYATRAEETLKSKTEAELKRAS